MRELLALTKALSDATRVRMLMALRGGELCVCQLIALTGLAPSTVSKHMSILRGARLVESRKDGRWMNYRLAGRRAPRAARRALAWAFESLAGDERVAEDARRLESILAVPRGELCARAAGRAPGPRRAGADRS